MNIYHVICHVFCCLMLSSVSFANKWNDAPTLKKELISTAQKGQSYYSQYNFYNPRKSGKLKSVYEKVLRCRPQIYGVDFYYASGTWFSQTDKNLARRNLVQVVKDSWRERRAVASFSWHLENPYVPTGFPLTAGFRYINSKHIPDYPVQHRYVIKEILENGGDVCGKGNLSGKDNELSYPSPRAWFEDRCKEVASIINDFIDDNGKPIPIIFRLWHEWEDYWMWWGARYVSAEDYKRFFILTELTIRKYAPKAQILWAYCSDRFWKTEDEYMRNYPGDDYVDIIGFDDYALGLSENNLLAATNRAMTICRIAKKRHLATALFETSNNKQKVPNFYTNYLNRMLKYPEVNLSIVQVWSLKNFNDSIDLRSFVNQKNIISREVKHE